MMRERCREIKDYQEKELYIGLGLHSGTKV